MIATRPSEDALSPTPSLPSESAARSQERAPECSTPWESVLDAVREDRHADEPLPPTLRAPPAETGARGLPFAGFFRPFLQVGAARVRAGLTQLSARHGLEPQALLTEEAGTDLLRALAQRLLALASRVLILELNVARVLERLPGDTPQARFLYYSTTWFQEPGAIASVLREYPVLAKLLSIAVAHHVHNTVELLERVATEREDLGAAFLEGRDPGALSGVELGLSDPHRGGRSVAVLRFSSGARLVYKPKSMAVEARFQDVLRWLNGLGPRHAHRVLTVLDRGDHGWVEFVEAGGCDSREALQRFYWRQGSSLALLHLFSATDFHMENLIAAGEHPVLVDLEALFHNRLQTPSPATAVERAWEELNGSVLAVGLLPVLLFGRAGRAGIDMSGLGGEAGQLSPQAMSMVEDANRDTMHVVRRQARMEGSHNRPTLDGVPAQAQDFTDDIVRGFEETWRLLSDQPWALDAWLDAFAHVEVRHIVRATQRYALLLHESHHPDFLRDDAERNRVLDHLSTELEVLPELGPLVPHERADLEQGDIPLFTARPGQRHLWSSTGARLPDVFPRDSLSEARERVRRMDMEGCARQVALIRQSMVSLDKGWASASPVSREEPAGSLEAPAPEAYLDAAVALGERLAAKALRGREDAGWIGLVPDGLEHLRWGLAPLGADLYEGTPGLALFFAYLGARTGRADFEALARAALEPMRRAWREPAAPGGDGVGVFAGRGAAVHVLGQLATLWNEPALLDELYAGLPVLEGLIDQDPMLDIIGGSAGCAVALLGVHQRTGDARLLAAAKRCADRLVAMAKPQDDGSVGWTGVDPSPLTGFSHGAAGIAWALLEVATATGDARYADVARKGLRYERSLFMPGQGNWKDLRNPGGTAAPEAEEHGMAAWCHGAPGVALSRALSLRHVAADCAEAARMREELRVGLETTLRLGFGGNHSLCHGDLGNLEVLHLAGTVLGDARWTREARAQAARVLRDGVAHGWRCGLPRSAESPGLMMGLAGIGLGLLRLAAPEAVPSVLALEAAPGAHYSERIASTGSSFAARAAG